MLKQNKYVRPLGKPELEHCDNEIHNFDHPFCLRYFLLVHRMPALDRSLIVEKHGEPVCYATWENGQRVRLTMASRLGDVGICAAKDEASGYAFRVLISDLSDFSEEI